MIPAFPPTPLQNRGRNFVRSKRRSTYTSSGTLYLFCALTIRKHLLNLSGRGPSICYRRPFCRLKAPLGLSLLRCASQTRSMRFERSGRGQEPSSGHKFSILENFLSIRDFTSQTLASFPSDLVGVALVGVTPLHLLSQTALPLKSPTGAFIAPLRFANAVPPQTLLIFAPCGAKERRVVLYITSPRSYRTDRRYNDQNECSTDS